MGRSSLSQTKAKILQAIGRVVGREKCYMRVRKEGKILKEIIVTMLLIQYYIMQVILKYVHVHMCGCILIQLPLTIIVQTKPTKSDYL